MFVRTYTGSHRFGNRSQFIKTVAKSDLLETKSARMSFGIAAAGMERIQIPAGQRLDAIAIETHRRLLLDLANRSEISIVAW